MALLKRIKAATLMETLVATVLLVIFFTVASLLLNNWLGSSVKYHSGQVQPRLHQLQYEYLHGKITLPYREEHAGWTYTVLREEQHGTEEIVFEASDPQQKRTYEIRSVFGK